MYYVYVLKCKDREELYYGYSSDIERRLKEHNTSGNYALVYYEAFKKEKDVRSREQKLKHYGQARTHLKKRIHESINA
ncbi:MAG: GIY-YIG nuclease family protein [Candidatus Omnitrophica bacterium]|nr:GIY-YIG nuclease family protein [Candidatus Omnitrophota bacterium]